MEYISTEELAALIRLVSDDLNNSDSGVAGFVVYPLRKYVTPMCHVGQGHLMNASDEGFRMQLEWYAGQLLSMVDNQQWAGINSWINCTDKFTNRIEK